MKALNELWVLGLGDVQALEEGRERAHPPPQEQGALKVPARHFHVTISFLRA